MEAVYEYQESCSCCGPEEVLVGWEFYNQEAYSTQEQALKVIKEHYVEIGYSGVEFTSLEDLEGYSLNIKELKTNKY